VAEAVGSCSPLQSVGRPATLLGSGLSLRERSGGTITRLEGRRSGLALTGCLAAWGIADLPASGRCENGASVLLPVGPDIWFLLADAPAPTEGAFDLALDMTGAWTRIAISGANASVLLAKGCAIDLHPRMFAAGACAAAGFAGMRTAIWRTEAGGFELLVGRSYALSLWEWLVDAASEYVGEGAAAADRTHERKDRP
jgi:heterotetrameric sarcosine oxidase gamma subunit